MSEHKQEKHADIGQQFDRILAEMFGPGKARPVGISISWCDATGKTIMGMCIECPRTLEENDGPAMGTIVHWMIGALEANKLHLFQHYENIRKREAGSRAMKDLIAMISADDSGKPN